MIVISPAGSDGSVTLRTDGLGQVIKAIGTHGYDGACLTLFEQALDAEHWALFHYRANNSVSCIATASRVYMAAALENIDRFVTRCHRVDPSVIALKQRLPEPTCVTKMDIGDIRDRQYRQRAYQKLGISRQNELVALVNNLRVDQDARCGARQVAS